MKVVIDGLVKTSGQDLIFIQCGGGVPPSATAFFLSTNFTLDAGDTALDGTRAVGTLAPGASSSGATTLTIPSGTASGLYYIIAKADGAALWSRPTK